MQLSHSRLACFQRCRRRYLWSYIDGYRAKEKHVGQAAGTAGHEAIALWYMQGRDTEAAVAKARSLLTDFPKKADELDAVLRRYFAWAREHDDFEMLAAEQEFHFPLVDGHVLYGITDGILKRKDGNVFLLENKFNKQATTSHLSLDRQCSVYLLAFQHLRPSGVLYNVVRMTGGPTALREPALRDYTFRSQYAVELTRRELCCAAKDVHNYEQLSRNDLLRASYSSPTGQCNWDCDFYGVCLSLTDSGDTSALKTQFVKRGEGRQPYVSAVTRTLDVDL